MDLLSIAVIAPAMAAVSRKAEHSLRGAGEAKSRFRLMKFAIPHIHHLPKGAERGVAGLPRV